MTQLCICLKLIQTPNLLTEPRAHSSLILEGNASTRTSRFHSYQIQENINIGDKILVINKVKDDISLKCWMGEIVPHSKGC